MCVLCSSFLHGTCLPALEKKLVFTTCRGGKLVTHAAPPEHNGKGGKLRTTKPLTETAVDEGCFGLEEDDAEEACVASMKHEQRRLGKKK